MSGLLVWVTVTIFGGRPTEVGGSTDTMDMTQMGSVTDKWDVIPSVLEEA